MFSRKRWNELYNLSSSYCTTGEDGAMIFCLKDGKTISMTKQGQETVLVGLTKEDQWDLWMGKYKS